MNKKVKKLVLGLLFLIFSTSNILFLYYLLKLNGIENIIRYGITIVIVIIWILLAIHFIKRFKKKQSPTLKLGIILLIYLVLICFFTFQIWKAYSTLEAIANNKNVYSTSIVSLASNSVDDISEIKNVAIGMLEDTSSIEGHELAREIINEEKLTGDIIFYESFISLIDGLLEGEVQYIFLPTNYDILFQGIDHLSNIKEQTKIIYTYTQTKQVATSSNKSLTEPFTILIMGVDSELENIQDGTFNGDALMLITFNPKTFSSTILSIPRDTYVPITCFTENRKNKITHAAWYGEECVIDTIENFMDIEIDYYVKINFKGAVKLVDALGGIELEVPFSFCEQDSNRLWGDNTVYVEEGWQLLNGEQTLALARNRHANPSMCSSKWTNYPSNDFIRGQNQQLIVKALLNKTKSIRSLDTVYELLDTLANNMETNMSTNEILSLYNIGKEILLRSSDEDSSDLIHMQRLYLSGYDQYIYDYNYKVNQGTKLTLYNFVAYNGSIEDVQLAMKTNLGLVDQTVIKEFSFSVEDHYTETVVGRGTYNEKNMTLVPNFVGSDISMAETFGKTYGITITTKYIESNRTAGVILSQSVATKTDLTAISNIIIQVAQSKTSTATDTIDCSEEINKNQTVCLVPNFIGKSYTTFTAWIKNNPYNFSYKAIEGNDASDEDDNNVIYKQGIEAGTSIYDLIGKTITVTYYKAIKE